MGYTLRLRNRVTGQQVEAAHPTFGAAMQELMRYARYWNYEVTPDVSTSGVLRSRVADVDYDWVIEDSSRNGLDKTASRGQHG